MTLSVLTVLLLPFQEIFLKQIESAQRHEEMVRGGVPTSGVVKVRASHQAGSSDSGGGKAAKGSVVSESEKEALRLQAIDAYRSQKKGGVGGATMQSLKALVNKGASGAGF